MAAGEREASSDSSPARNTSSGSGLRWWFIVPFTGGGDPTRRRRHTPACGCRICGERHSLGLPNRDARSTLVRRSRLVEARRDRRGVRSERLAMGRVVPCRGPQGEGPQIWLERASARRLPRRPPAACKDGVGMPSFGRGGHNHVDRCPTGGGQKLNGLQVATIWVSGGGR